VRPIEEELVLLELEPMDVPPGDGPATIQIKFNTITGYMILYCNSSRS
jgi:hypothetical protein